jgi:hypothetical protein
MSTYKNEIEVGQNDFGYPINMQVTDSDGEAFPLTDYAVQWQVTEYGKTTPKFTGDCTVTEESEGKIKYDVLEGNFDEADKIYATVILATKTGVTLSFDGPLLVCWGRQTGARDFCDDVLKLVNLTTTQISYVNTWLLVQKAIEYATEELNSSLIFGSLNYNERLLIKDLAAVAAALKVSGGASSGSSFSLGDFSVKSETSTETEASSNIASLKAEITRLLDLLSEPAFKVAQA